MVAGDLRSLGVEGGARRRRRAVYRTDGPNGTEWQHLDVPGCCRSGQDEHYLHGPWDLDLDFGLISGCPPRSSLVWVDLAWEWLSCCLMAG